MPATIRFLVNVLEKIPIAVKVPPKIIKKIPLPIQCEIILKPRFFPCSGKNISNSSGKQKERSEINKKKKKHAVHFPITSSAILIGAEINVSRVPSLRSSAKDLIVMNGIKAGEPNNNPTTNDAKGGRIQSEEVKLSMKNLKPNAINERK